MCYTSVHTCLAEIFYSEVCQEHGLSSGIFRGCFPPYFFEAGSMSHWTWSWTICLYWLWADSCGHPPVLNSKVLRIYAAMSGFYKNPHGCIASTLPSEPSMWPLVFNCYANSYYLLFCFLKKSPWRTTIQLVENFLGRLWGPVLSL